MLRYFDEIKKEDYESYKIDSNYHTHNYMCHHAKGTVSDYVKEAQALGFVELGISDHFANPQTKNKNYTSKENIEEYLSQFQVAKDECGEQIRLYRGAEIEYYTGFDSYYLDLLSRLDYLVLGQHEFLHEGHVHNSFSDGNTEERVLSFLNQLKEGVQSGFFKLLAHPDVIFFSGFEPTEKVKNSFLELIQIAKENKVIVEINASKTFSTPFFYPTDLLIDSLKETQAPAIVSSDAHNPQMLMYENLKKLNRYAEKMGVNLVHRIEFEQ